MFSKKIIQSKASGLYPCQVPLTDSKSSLSNSYNVKSGKKRYLEYYVLIDHKEKETEENPLEYKPLLPKKNHETKEDMVVSKIIQVCCMKHRNGLQAEENSIIFLKVMKEVKQQFGFSRNLHQKLSDLLESGKWLEKTDCTHWEFDKQLSFVQAFKAAVAIFSSEEK